ncbi:MAG: TetR/AcrR family transcriptional regulator [Anaerolineae bacterium]|jgi:AcrR family transcriptional regulator
MGTDKTAVGRQCILDRAQALFAAHGYHGVSIRDIVHACGLSNAALYYHFGNKQNLFIEVLRAYVSAMIERLRAASQGGGTCRQRLVRVAGSYARFIAESQSAIQVLLRDVAQFEQEEIQQMLPDMETQIPGVIATILEEGIKAGEVGAIDTQDVGTMLLGMVNALVMRRLYAGAGKNLDKDVEGALDLLFEGIGI